MSVSTFHLGDAGDFDVLAGPGSLDCIVQDPPAGVHFMENAFDRDHGGRDAWIKLHAGLFAAGRRACKPGAWSLTWAMPRTSGWTHMALEDAGWEITDCITAINGQGWPKNARTQLKPSSEHWYLARNGGGGSLQIDASRVARGAGDRKDRIGGTAPKWGTNTYASDEYSRGIIGTISPAHPGGSWPTNVLLSHCEPCRERGTREVSTAGSGSAVFVREATHVNCYGADNRTPGTQQIKYAAPSGLETVHAFDCLAACSCGLTTLAPSGGQPPRCDCGEAMSWACPVAELDGQSGTLKSGSRVAGVRKGAGYGGNSTGDGGSAIEASEGGASRFFPSFAYAAKAATAERHAGAEHLRWARDKGASFGWREVDQATWDELPASERGTCNVHPTVKSLKLARWLVRLLCPPGGRGGDPFCGSGSIGIAAALEGFEWISSDLSPEAVRIAQARMVHWEAQGKKPEKTPVKRSKTAPVVARAVVDTSTSKPAAQISLFSPGSVRRPLA